MEEQLFNYGSFDNFMVYAPYMQPYNFALIPNGFNKYSFIDKFTRTFYDSHTEVEIKKLFNE